MEVKSLLLPGFAPVDDSPLRDLEFNGSNPFKATKLIYKPKTLFIMKTLYINIQTNVYLSESGRSVIAAYNKHSQILVINKPIISPVELTLLKLSHPASQVFETDSFGINFYNPNTGGQSEFHEIGIDTPVDPEN